MPNSWTPLKPNDTVQIIAPASKTLHPAEDLVAVKKLLTDWQLTPKISAEIFGDDLNFPGLANTDEKRFADLKNALLDPEVKAIWCIRGGYGIIRLLSRLAAEFKHALPAKLFIGFSDVTLLYLYFNQVWHWSTIHGPVAKQVANAEIDAADIDTLKKIIFGEVDTVNINDLIPLNAVAKKTATVQSTVTGGNLTLVNRTLGTPYAIEMKNKIVILEDPDEPFRKIDGMLQQFILAGYLTTEKKPAAIILGDFTIKNEKEQQQVNNALEEFAEKLALANIPAFRCVGIGHGKINHPIPFNTLATLTLGVKPILSIKIN